MMRCESAARRFGGDLCAGVYKQEMEGKWKE
jgi:hypothetical protein